MKIPQPIRNPSDVYLNSLIILLIFSSVLYFFTFVTADPDLWGHIKFGKDMWNTGTIPRVDIYSYTAYGRQWINHEWLSEIIMYLTFNLLGSPGLLAGKILIGLFIILLLLKISMFRKANPVILGLVLVTSIFIMSPGFMTRPQIATFLYTSIFLYIFHLFFEKNTNLLWCLPLVMILWVNSHGGFLIGLGIFPVIFCAELISCLLKNKSKRHLRILLFWIVLTSLAVLINPYGSDLLLFLKESLRTPRNITEWNAVSLTDLSYARLKIFSVFVVGSFFIDWKKNRLWEVSIIIIAMINAYLHQRHTPVFAIFAAPFLCEKLTFFVEGLGKYNLRIRSRTSYVLLSTATALLIVFQLTSFAEKIVKTKFNIIVDPSVYPVRSVRFLKEHKIGGNIMVPFDWGEYVIWHLYPECRVSVDGRFRTVYPEKILEDHINSMYNPNLISEMVDRYPSDILLLENNPASLTLKQKPEKWIYFYSDPTALIFLKNNERSRQIIKRLKSKKNEPVSKAFSYYFP